MYKNEIENLDKERIASVKTLADFFNVLKK